MATIVQRRLISNGLVDFLVTANITASNIHNKFDLMKAPDPIPTDLAYGIIYPLRGVQFPAPKFDGGDPLAALPYQVTSVGYGLDQAEDLADRVRAIMTDSQTYPFLVIGQSIVFRDLYGGPSEPMLDPNSDLVSITERFLIYAAV